MGSFKSIYLTKKTKNGCNPDQMLYLADLVESASNINLRGIMALPDINANASDRETEMREIIDLSKKLQKNILMQVRYQWELLMILKKQLCMAQLWLE